eukprot:gene2113-2811_t
MDLAVAVSADAAAGNALSGNVKLSLGSATAHIPAGSLAADVAAALAAAFPDRGHMQVAEAPRTAWKSNGRSGLSAAAGADQVPNESIVLETRPHTATSSITTIEQARTAWSAAPAQETYGQYCPPTFMGYGQRVSNAECGGSATADVALKLTYAFKVCASMEGRWHFYFQAPSAHRIVQYSVDAADVTSLDLPELANSTRPLDVAVELQAGWHSLEVFAFVATSTGLGSFEVLPPSNQAAWQLSGKGSALTCAELGWTGATKADSSGEVQACGQSPTQCEGDKLFADAGAYCTSLGARLCSSTELLGMRSWFVANDNRCSANFYHLWTSTPCDGGYETVMLADRSDGWNPKTQCLSSFGSARTGRCCADVADTVVVRVAHAEDENVALQGSASLSSTYEPASRAVDGDFELMLARSNWDSNPWLQVQLARAWRIDRVSVFGRRDGCAARFLRGSSCGGKEIAGTFDGDQQGAVVGVSTQPCVGDVCYGTICGKITRSSATQIYTVDCEGAYGSYVYVMLPGSRRFLELYEMTVTRLAEDERFDCGVTPVCNAMEYEVSFAEPSRGPAELFTVDTSALVAPALAGPVHSSARRVQEGGLLVLPVDSSLLQTYTDQPQGYFARLKVKVRCDAARLKVKVRFDAARLKVKVRSSFADVSDQQDLVIEAEAIIVNGAGAVLQAGTVSQPHARNVEIVLCGDIYTPMLPVFGIKVLAVHSQGRISLHGTPTSAWTRLALPAYPGDTTLTLQSGVDWVVGDLIVLAPTSALWSEDEAFTVVGVGGGGTVLTLNASVAYTHAAHTETVTSDHGARSIEMYAEVAKLNRNIKIHGVHRRHLSSGTTLLEDGTRVSWQDNSTREFHVANQFGAQVMMFELADAQLHHVELNFMGQAFQMGRYAVHFHKSIDMTGSQMTNCVVHRSFNRVLTIHATDHLLVQNNVGYDIMPDPSGAKPRRRSPTIHLADAAHREKALNAHLREQFNITDVPAHRIKSPLTPGSQEGVASSRRALQSAWTWSDTATWGGNCPPNTCELDTEIVLILAGQVMTLDMDIRVRILIVEGELHLSDDKGNAIFLEEGGETENRIERNLVIRNVNSLSLQSEDAVASAFWISNPTNYFEGNVAAGCMEHGFWFDLIDKVMATSLDLPHAQNINPQTSPLGSFNNNSDQGIPGRQGPNRHAHLQITPNDSLHPSTVGITEVSFENFRLADNSIANFLIACTTPAGNWFGPQVNNALVVGRSGVQWGTAARLTGKGVWFGGPATRFAWVNGSTFANFGSDTSVFGGCNDCMPLAGGQEHRLSDIRFENCATRFGYQWAHECTYYDIDGTSTGYAGGWATQATNLLPFTTGTSSIDGSQVTQHCWMATFGGAVCDSTVKMRYLTWDNADPMDLNHKVVKFTSRHGTQFVQPHKAMHGITNYAGAPCPGCGDHAILPSNEVYTFHPCYGHNGMSCPDGSSGTSADWFVQPKVVQIAGHLMEEGESLAIRMRRMSDPYLFSEVWNNGQGDDDKVYTISNGQSLAEASWSAAQSASSSALGTWYYDEPENKFSLVAVPVDGDEVEVPGHWTLVVDTHTAVVRKVSVLGVLTFSTEVDASLSTYHLHVSKFGNVSIGSVAEPHRRQASILLHGDRLEDQTNPMATSKSIIVEGGMQMIGPECSASWAKLALTASAGATSVTINVPAQQAADCWLVGDKLVVTPSRFFGNRHEYDEVTVTAVETSSEGLITLQLDAALAYAHVGLTEISGGGLSVQLAAEVGRLSRNLRVEGADGDTLSSTYQQFGARLTTEGGGELHLRGVEFYRAGQLGGYGTYPDAVALYQTDKATVEHCAFHDLYHVALGVYASSSAHVRNNVMFGGSPSASPGFRIMAVALFAKDAEAHFAGNLLIGSKNGNGRDAANCLASDNYLEADAGISQRYRRSTVTNNVAVGCEVGYFLRGADCGSGNHEGNEVRSALTGYWFYGRRNTHCVEISGLIAWRTDVGIYSGFLPESWGGAMLSLHPTGTAREFRLRGFKAVQNKETSLAFINFNAAPQDNVYLTFHITGCLFAGGFEAAGAPSEDWAETGVWLPVYTAGTSWSNHQLEVSEGPHLMGSDTIRAQTYLNNSVFVSFKYGSKAISVFQRQKEVTHPCKTASLTFQDTELDNRVWYPPSGRTAGGLNSKCTHAWDKDCCSEVHCDAHRHLLILDTDGSLLGVSGATSGSIISRWDVGMVNPDVFADTVPLRLANKFTDLASEIDASRQGVARPGCEWVAGWDAYRCAGDAGRHRMLYVKSLDGDGMTRRFGPISVSSCVTPDAEGVCSDAVVDTLSGMPWWRHSAGNHHRRSAFYLIVRMDRQHSIFLTGNAPKKLQFTMLDAEPEDNVMMTLDFPRPNAIQVQRRSLANGSWTAVEEYPRCNYTWVSGQGNIPMTPLSTVYSEVASLPSGTHYRNKTAQKFSFVLKGSDTLVVEEQYEVRLTLSLQVSHSDFYAASGTDGLTRYIALLMGIPTSKVQVAGMGSIGGDGACAGWSCSRKLLGAKGSLGTRSGPATTVMEELVDGEWREVPEAEVDATGPQPLQRNPRRVRSMRRRLEGEEGTEIVLVAEGNSTKPPEDDGYEGEMEQYTQESQTSSKLNNGADSVLKSIYSGAMSSELGVPVNEALVEPAEAPTPVTIGLEGGSTEASSGAALQTLYTRILDRNAQLCTKLLVSETVKVAAAVASPARGVSLQNAEGVVNGGVATFSDLKVIADRRAWTTVTISSGISVTLRFTTNVANISATLTLTLTPPTPSFPSGFTCEFACQDGERCPCHAYECEDATAASRLARTRASPVCLKTILQHCAAHPSDHGCAKYLASASEVADISSTAGGSIASATPAMGGKGAGLHIPGGALDADATLAVGEYDAADISAALDPASESASSTFLALTPHGQTFTTPVTVQIPYRKAPGINMKLMYAADASSTSFSALQGVSYSDHSVDVGIATVSISRFSVYVVTTDG